MSKGKLSNDYVISNILNFVNSDDDEDLDSNDEFHSEDLNELYDEPELDLDGNSLGDSSDSSDKDDTQARPHRNVFTYNRLVNSLDKSLDPSCYDSHDFGTTDSIANEEVLAGYLGRIPKFKKLSGPTKNHSMLVANAPVIPALKVIRHFFHQQSVWNQSLIHSKYCFYNI